MAEKSKKPAIRFAGFTEAWEQRKLEGIIQECNVRTSDFRNNPLYSLTIENGVTPKTERYERSSLVIKTEDLFKVVKPNVFVTNPMNLRFGALGYNKNTFNVAVSGYYDVFSIDDNKCSGFWNSYFKTSKSIKIFDDVATGSLIEKRRVKYSTLQQLELYMPKDLDEKIQIGSYMNQIDNLITLHQRKYDKLVNVKKAMLEKMFPKDGADVPEIRFKGFTEAWEQRKVGELLIERNEQAPMSDDYPLMAFIANEGVTPKGDRYDRSSLVNDVSGKLYKHTEFGDFIYSSNNLESGSIGLNKYGNACISPVYSIFQSTEISDPEFIGRRFLRKDFINSMIKWRQGVIYGQWRIHESDFVKIEVIIPSLIEQKRVGKFLNQLDNLITLHQRKLEKLKNLKKACLEKMFV